MATIAVADEEVDLLKRGGLCAKSGLPATHALSMQAVHTPSWIWILVFFGIFPLLIAYLATKQAIGIEVPASDEVIRRRSRATVAIVVAALVSLAVAIAAGAAKELALVWIGVVGLMLVVMALPFWARTWITATYDGRMVRLSQVHPNFVAAVEGLRSSGGS